MTLHASNTTLDHFLLFVPKFEDFYSKMKLNPLKFQKSQWFIAKLQLEGLHGKIRHYNSIGFFLIFSHWKFIYISNNSILIKKIKSIILSLLIFIIFYRQHLYFIFTYMDTFKCFYVVSNTFQSINNFDLWFLRCYFIDG